MEYPEGLRYTHDHTWIADTESTALRIGITDFAQSELAEILFVDLPEIGRQVAKDDLIVELESTKSVGEVYAPFAGTVHAVNLDLDESPSLVNLEPYQAGWLVEIDPKEPLTTHSDFLTESQYRDLVE